MTDEDARSSVVAYWLDKSAEALASADSEYEAGRYAFTVNRAYYACFYALSAVLLSRGTKFVKHSGVRAALHSHLVRTGRLTTEWGRFYDRVYENRQRGDYQELVGFEADQADALRTQARGFVAEMRRLLDQKAQA